MPVPTPFHPRTSPLCTSLSWKDWAGYHAVRSYDTCHVPEYFAVRHAAGLLDVTPLFKVLVRGEDAEAFLAWVTARDVTRMKDGQVAYCTWCDPDGKTLDDGTITRFSRTSYRVTSAEPSLAWLARCARGFAIELLDVTEEVCALALQGPTARAILDDCTDGGDVATLRFFRSTRTRIAGRDVEVTRTGYTGDLGYELWLANEDALPVYDAVTEAGRPHGLLPLGLDALDLLRIEAGFILMGVDYFSARRALIEDQKSSPFELGLGWTVHTGRGPFVGSEALEREKCEGSGWALVGLDADWTEIEALFDRYGLPPHLPEAASREPVPVYDGVVQVGRATSRAWSPTLKKYIALASVRARFAEPGTRLALEMTVEFERRTVAATVVPRPFFDPQRKRSTPALASAT